MSMIALRMLHGSCSGVTRSGSHLPLLDVSCLADFEDGPATAGLQRGRCGCR